ISKLSSQRNTLAPISRLPPEVLAKIFIEFRDEARGSENTCFSDILTWICRHWREVAVNCSTLWSEIDFHHLPSVELHLARSK
ncbi:hypothetical protein BDN72DRAFT_750940, partial [Pluteus cervinus]